QADEAHRLDPHLEYGFGKTRFERSQRRLPQFVRDVGIAERKRHLLHPLSSEKVGWPQPGRAQTLGLMKRCSCGEYARLYALIHRATATMFPALAGAMNRLPPRRSNGEFVIYCRGFAKAREAARGRCFHRVVHTCGERVPLAGRNGATVRPEWPQPRGFSGRGDRERQSADRPPRSTCRRMVVAGRT